MLRYLSFGSSKKAPFGHKKGQRSQIWSKDRSIPNIGRGGGMCTGGSSCDLNVEPSSCCPKKHCQTFTTSCIKLWQHWRRRHELISIIAACRRAGAEDADQDGQLSPPVARVPTRSHSYRARSFRDLDGEAAIMFAIAATSATPSGMLLLGLSKEVQFGILEKDT